MISNLITKTSNIHSKENTKLKIVSMAQITIDNIPFALKDLNKVDYK